MDFAPVYLIQQLFHRITDFFHHWYVDGSRTTRNKLMLTLRAIDRKFGIKLTQRQFSGQQKSRIAMGAVIDLLIAAIFATAYIVWLAIPATILWYVVMGKL